VVNPVELEQAYEKFAGNLSKWVPDGVIHVDLKLLDELGLLKQEHFEESDNDDDEEQFPHYFHVIETDDKVTLFNHQFAVWIVPQMVDDTPTTLTLISLISGVEPRLELAFATSGVYNTPKFVLRVLKHYLTEVLDTESVISSIHKS